MVTLAWHLIPAVIFLALSVSLTNIQTSTLNRLVKAMVFPVVTYGCESWIVKKAECRRIAAFELWCWRRLLRVPWTARRSNQSILKEISPGYSGRNDAEAETLVIWPPHAELTHWKRPWCWERLKVGGAGDDRGEMAGWHHRLYGHGFE